MLIPDSMSIKGVIIVDQIKSLDYRARNMEIVDRAPDDVVETCIKKIRTFL